LKHPDREAITRLEALPNVGKAIAAKLRSIGIFQPGDLVGRDPFQLYEQLSTSSDQRADPCLLDVLMSVVHFMEGGEPLPWWSFTDARKRALKSSRR